MAITSLADIAKTLPANTITRTSRANASALATLVSAQSDSGNSQVDALSQVIGLQSQTAALRSASVNIAQASSLLEVASNGVTTIEDSLKQLEILANKAANPALSDQDRADLQTQANALITAINKTTQNTSFGGTKLLDGSIAANRGGAQDIELGSGTADQFGLHLNDLSTKTLFGGAAFDLSTADGAAAASTLISQAASQVNDVVDQLNSFAEKFNTISATLDSALQNQQAATSTLLGFGESDGDGGLLSLIQAKSGVALLAQGNKLQSGILDLLGS